MSAVVVAVVRRRAWRRVLLLVALLLAAAAVVVGLLARSGYWPITVRRTVTSASFAERWPFSTRSAQLVCDRSIDRSLTLSVVVAGRTYALNERASEAGLPDASSAFTDAARAAGPDRALTLIALTEDTHDLCAAR